MVDPAMVVGPPVDMEEGPLHRLEERTGLRVHAFPKEREYFVGLRLLADTGEDDDTE